MEECFAYERSFWLQQELIMLTYISNSAHYKEVLSRVLHVKESLWIGTADIKDLYIEED